MKARLNQSLNQFEVYSIILVFMFGILILSLHKIYWVENKVENEYLKYWQNI